MAETNLRHFVAGLILLTILIIAGTYSFSAIEGLGLFEAFYQIVLIITTHGTTIGISTHYGKLLVMFILAFGMGLVLYIAIFFASAIIEGQTMLLLGGIKGGLVRMKKERNHTIVCGYGKLGKNVCDMLKEKKQKYMILEKDSQKCTNLIANGESVLQGDALDPDVLKKANITKARGLIATLDEDSDNMYLIMSASELNPKLDLAAKAEDEHAVSRLHKVGAKIVVLPQVVGGRQLADAFLQMEKSQELETVSKKN
jgi:voltage-gated potassium channel